MPLPSSVTAVDGAKAETAASVVTTDYNTQLRASR
jgi:hypothetical protein